jgi:hypothetical protein
LEDRDFETNTQSVDKQVAEKQAKWLERILAEDERDRHLNPQKLIAFNNQPGYAETVQTYGYSGTFTA